jgi:hypothetical protein
MRHSSTYQIFFNVHLDKGLQHIFIINLFDNLSFRHPLDIGKVLNLDMLIFTFFLLGD